MTIADIPKVRLYDEHGEYLYEGYYFRMPERCPYPIKSGFPGSEPPEVEYVITVQWGDWGLANDIYPVRVRPGWRLEVVEDGGKSSENNDNAADAAKEGASCTSRH